MSKSFRDLLVWQKAIELVIYLYEVTKNFPKSETYSLVDQMHRCAVSVPSNIAEGHQRHTVKEFVQFGHIAYGSCAELRTQTIISHKLGYLSTTQAEKLTAMIDEIEKMLYSLMKKIEK